MGIRCIRDEQRHTSPPCFEGVLSVDSGRGIFHGLIVRNSTLRGDKNGFVDTSKLFRRPQNEQHKAPSPLAPGGGFCWASGTRTGEGASFAGGWRHAIRPRLPALLAQCDRSGVL